MTSFITVPSTLVAYWRLDEPNDGTATVFKDSSGNGTNYYDPTTASPPFTLQSVVQFREVYLLLCPEGQYTQWDSSLGYYTCLNCDSSCKGCNGTGPNNCTECNLPYKLLQQEQQCLIINTCPSGYYMDSSSGLCF